MSTAFPSIIPLGGKPPTDEEDEKKVPISSQGFHSQPLHVNTVHGTINVNVYVSLNFNHPVDPETMNQVLNKIGPLSNVTFATTAPTSERRESPIPSTPHPSSVPTAPAISTFGPNTRLTVPLPAGTIYKEPPGFQHLLYETKKSSPPK
jgi:hypothetical protein